MTTHYSTDTWWQTRWHLDKPAGAVPLPIAVEVAETVEAACRWFHDPRHIFLGDPAAPAFPDEVVDEVCRALQCQLDKEGKSRTHGATCHKHHVAHTEWYHLDKLPPARRRALVERVWAIKERERISVPVYESDEAPAPVRAYAPWVDG